ncbi:MAG: PAS domain-containing hybrid sensor histidine kinase/response regulator [Desulfobacteria bacterium]
MVRKDSSRSDPAGLRRRAEELLQGIPADLATISADESRRLLHELRVHQIELEMQNDELRNAQQGLEASRVKYFDLYNIAPVGYFTVSEKGSILEANLRGADLLGVERDLLVRQPLTRYIVPEDQDIYYLHRKRVLETGARQGCELRMCHRDGSPFWARLEAGAAREGEDGPPVYRIAVSDITEQKRAEEELKESRERLVEAQMVARLGYYGLDVITGMWTSSNILDEIFGIGDDYRRNVEGWSLLVHPEDRQSMLEHFRREVLAEKRPFDRVYRIVRPSDQCVRWVHGLGKVEYDSGGKPAKMIGTIQDITESMQVEEEKRNLERLVQQKQKLESLGVLAGGIAHDFNNLLMVVLGHAELALREISPLSPARRNLQEITTAAQRATDLSLQMLAYAGKAVFTVERVGLRELIEEMAHLLKTASSKKAILNLNLERNLPPIEADPSQIRQIVMNLIINASEAIGDRSGVITVSVGATQCDEEYLKESELQDSLPPGLYVRLEVTDTGIGMNAGTRSRIFEPFFSTKFTGRGLGLAAVLGIVRAHKGALKVYSEPGKGTTFKVLFPALEDAGTEARTNDSSARADWRGKGTILLVDDEEGLIDVGSQMLEGLGFTVLTAADGLQAVDLYRERGKEIDLVLMDVAMPHMDGAEAFGELRRMNPEVRIVLASGYSHEDVALRFAGKGLAGVLQKPYNLARLWETLAGLMPERIAGEG